MQWPGVNLGIWTNGTFSWSCCQLKWPPLYRSLVLISDCLPVWDDWLTPGCPATPDPGHGGMQSRAADNFIKEPSHQKCLGPRGIFDKFSRETETNAVLCGMCGDISENGELCGDFVWKHLWIVSRMFRAVSLRFWDNSNVINLLHTLVS